MRYLVESYDPSWSRCFHGLAEELAAVDLALAERSDRVIYPPKELIFNAFVHTKADAVQAVIIGQDPYHGHGEAMGLSFSVPHGVAIPPSLRNIFKERESDLGIPVNGSGDLTPWADRGVLLLIKQTAKYGSA